MSEHGLATVRGRLLARLGRLIEKPPRLDAAERFVAHLAVEFPAVFAFLFSCPHVIRFTGSCEVLKR